MAKKEKLPLTKKERRERRKARRHAKAEGARWDCEKWIVTFRRVHPRRKKVA